MRWLLLLPGLILACGLTEVPFLAIGERIELMPGEVRTREYELSPGDQVRFEVKQEIGADELTPYQASSDGAMDANVATAERVRYWVTSPSGATIVNEAFAPSPEDRITFVAEEQGIYTFSLRLPAEAQRGRIATWSFSFAYCSKKNADLISSC